MTNAKRLDTLEQTALYADFPEDEEAIKEILTIAREQQDEITRLKAERDNAVGLAGYRLEQVDHLKARIDGKSIIPCCDARAEVKRLRAGIAALHTYKTSPGEEKIWILASELHALLNKETP